MEKIEFIVKYDFNKKTLYRSRRDELVSLITDDINSLRVGTKWKPISKKRVAILINKNPFLAHDEGEIYALYKQCNERRNYSMFFYVTK